MSRIFLSLLVLLSANFARAAEDQVCQTLLASYPHANMEQALDPRYDVITARTASSFFLGAHTLIIYVNNRAVITFHKKIIVDAPVPTAFPGATISQGLYTAAAQINAAVKGAADRGRQLRIDFTALQSWRNQGGECAVDGRSLPLLIDELETSSIPQHQNQPSTAGDRSEPVQVLTPRGELENDGDRG